MSAAIKTPAAIKEARHHMFRLLSDDRRADMVKATVTVSFLRSCEITNPDVPKNGHGVKFLIAQHSKFEKIRAEVCQDDKDVKKLADRRETARQFLATVLQMDRCPAQ